MRCPISYVLYKNVPMLCPARGERADLGFCRLSNSLRLCSESSKTFLEHRNRDLGERAAKNF